MNFECTYIIAYVVNLRSGDLTEGVASTVGILEVMQVLEGILEVRGVLREREKDGPFWLSVDLFFCLFGV